MQQDGLRIAMCISSDGLIAEAIIQACSEGRLRDVIPALVIASADEIDGIERAKSLGIRDSEIAIVDPGAFTSPDQFGAALLRECVTRQVDLVGLYGWRATIPENFIQAFPGRMVLQHPGPLDPGRPDFGGPEMFGRRVHAARLEYVALCGWAEAWSEVSAQIVQSDGLGPVIGSKRVVIEERSWGVDQLQAKTLGIEYLAQISALHSFATETVKEVVREEPLVPFRRLPQLLQAKAKAIADYPDG